MNVSRLQPAALAAAFLPARPVAAPSGAAGPTEGRALGPAATVTLSAQADTRTAEDKWAALAKRLAASPEIRQKAENAYHAALRAAWDVQTKARGHQRSSEIAYKKRMHERETLVKALEKQLNMLLLMRCLHGASGLLESAIKAIVKQLQHVADGLARESETPAASSPPDGLFDPFQVIEAAVGETKPAEGSSPAHADLAGDHPPAAATAADDAGRNEARSGATPDAPVPLAVERVVNSMKASWAGLKRQDEDWKSEAAEWAEEKSARETAGMRKIRELLERIESAFGIRLSRKEGKPSGQAPGTAGQEPGGRADIRA